MQPTTISCNSGNIVFVNHLFFSYLNLPVIIAAFTAENKDEQRKSNDPMNVLKYR